MKSWNRFGNAMALVACLGMVTPISAVAQTFEAQQVSYGKSFPQVSDVALTSQGVFQVRALDAEGQVAMGVPVRLRHGEVTIVDTQTDGTGQCAIKSLRGGLYQIAVGSRVSHVRIWTPNSAPPSAQAGLTVITGDVVRGQCAGATCTGCTTCGGGGGGLVSFLTNPFVIGAAVAAAIAIPLALDDDDDDDDAS